MAATGRRSSGPVLRSLSPSPSGRFYTQPSSSSAFASSTSNFSSGSSTFFKRPTSPNRLNIRNCPPSSPSVRFSTVRSSSPNHSISSPPRKQLVLSNNTQRTKTCMCSPTNHPGSFRCGLHKNLNNHQITSSYTSNGLNARRSAMTNSLVRIGTVEGDLVKRALAALIRPSSHHQKRRTSFQPRPSRLSIMSKSQLL